MVLCVPLWAKRGHARVQKTQHRGGNLTIRCIITFCWPPEYNCTLPVGLLFVYTLYVSNTARCTQFEMNSSQTCPAETPGPSNYSRKDGMTAKMARAGGGRFSTAKPKSDVEIAITRASAIPGPSDYICEAPGLAQGVRFNRGQSKSALEWTIYNAKQTPGPSSYDLPTTMK